MGPTIVQISGYVKQFKIYIIRIQELVALYAQYTHVVKFNY